MAQGVSEILTNFATQMLGLSIAAERVTEYIKQWRNSKAAAPAATLDAAAKHTANFQLVAFLSGVIVVGLTHTDPLEIVSKWGQFHVLSGGWQHLDHSPRVLSILVTGLLVSGGSGVWNHLLDILKASKVSTEEKTNDKLAVAGKPQIPA